MRAAIQGSIFAFALLLVAACGGGGAASSKASKPGGASEPTSAEPVGARSGAAPENGGGVGMNFRVVEMCTDYPSCVAACNGGQGFMCLQAFGKAPTDATKLSALKRGCDLRDPPSCGVLGIGYMNGELGLPKDEAMGLRFTSQACEAAIPDPTTHKIMEVIAMACVSAGRTYYRNEDGKKALSVFDRACPTEFQACRGAASVLLKGMGGVTPDSARAAVFMKRSCTAGDTPACEYTGAPRDWSTPTSASPPATTPASSPASSSSSVGGPIDRGVVPAGTGWHCFNQPLSYLLCERSSAACNAKRNAVRKVFLDSGDSPAAVNEAFGACLPVASPYCVTMPGTRSSELRCYPNRNV